MAVRYTVVDISLPSLNDDFLGQDLELIDSFRVNTLFNPAKHFIEVNYFIDNTIFFTETDYRRYRILFDSEIAGKQGASRITLDPIKDVENLGFIVPEVRAEYNYYNNLFTEDRSKVEFFIQELSQDRTEIRLQTTDISENTVIEYVNKLKQDLRSSSPFNDFKLLFEGGIAAVGINIDTQVVEGKTIAVVKLYSPLPSEIILKSKLQIVEEVADKTTFSIQSEIDQITSTPRRLSEPNFNIKVGDSTNILTDYYNLNTLLSQDESYNRDLSEVLAKSSDNSIVLNIDYSDFKNFINYSSAVERVKNFIYKVELLEEYEEKLDQLNTTPSSNTSKKYLQELIKGIIKNFDHYEQHLYFEKTNVAWPKQGVTKPYTLLPSTNSTVITWKNNLLEQADLFDISNINILLNTIPGYLREDERNEPYLLFVNMIGHHFDNLWIYTKAVTSKYDADNRLDKGLSKDLIEEVLKNFGIKLYSDTKSGADLFRYFTLDSYNPEDEVINTFVTGSNLDISAKDYNKEIYKRIYHNLPLLLKTKGTERSVRALITSFGIPTGTLPIRQYGGVDREQLPYFGQYLSTTGSVGKIRIGNRGPIEGVTLSTLTSIERSVDDYTQDIHNIEVGFSPSDNIDTYILSEIDSAFNLDNYTGDPSGKGYKELKKVAKDILGDLTRYNLKDFIRLIKFFDNKLFKMIADFAPARAVVDTGIIIKPHILEQANYDNIKVSGFEETITGSIDTAFISGSDGGSFGANSDYITSWIEEIQAPDGKVFKPSGDLVGRTDGETPRYTGEFSGSIIEVTDGELNRNNPFKKLRYEDIFYDIKSIVDSVPICTPFSGTAEFQS